MEHPFGKTVFIIGHSVGIPERNWKMQMGAVVLHKSEISCWYNNSATFSFISPLPTCEGLVEDRGNSHDPALLSLV